jgi:hypothetical protein
VVVKNTIANDIDVGTREAFKIEKKRVEEEAAKNELKCKAWREKKMGTTPK